MGELAPGFIVTVDRSREGVLVLREERRVKLGHVEKTGYACFDVLRAKLLGGKL
jgi:hypothetical protein